MGNPTVAFTKDEGFPAHRSPRLSRSSLPADLEVAPEDVPEDVLEVVDQSAMMDQDQPALMAQHQPVTMALPLSLTETCPPSLVRITVSLITVLMTGGLTPALMAAPPALADLEARDVPRRRESAVMDQLRHLTGTSPLHPALMEASPGALRMIAQNKFKSIQL